MEKIKKVKGNSVDKIGEQDMIPLSDVQADAMKSIGEILSCCKW